MFCVTKTKQRKKRLKYPNINGKNVNKYLIFYFLKKKKKKWHQILSRILDIESFPINEELKVWKFTFDNLFIKKMTIIIKIIIS